MDHYEPTFCIYHSERNCKYLSKKYDTFLPTEKKYDKGEKTTLSNFYSEFKFVFTNLDKIELKKTQYSLDRFWKFWP